MAELEIRPSFRLHTEVVEESTVEALLGAAQLGCKLKGLRLKRSMGLVELGRLAGLSASYLSQLESGRVIPTIRNLMRISMAHKVDLSYFFKDRSPNPFLISKAADRISLSFGSKAEPFMMSESMAALIPDRRIVPCIAELRSGLSDVRFEPQLFVGLEFTYVIEGSLQLSTAQETAILNEADVAWIDGSMVRNYQCVGEAIAKLMIISCPNRS